MSRRKRKEDCEVGPIRPPSEAMSLLIRLTRNCPWNKCAFCAVYKGSDFSKRDEDDVIAEIDLLAEAAARVREKAGVTSDAKGIPSEAFLAVVHDANSSYEEQRVATWLLHGGRNVFLQDADSLVRPPKKVIRVLRHLYDAFPSIDRVTTYARSRTLVARSPEQLAGLREAGLTRIHVGVESGSDEVLELIKKGCRADHHIVGCRRAVEGNFQVCCYVMPGLGGKQFTASHALETARVLREIDPHRVRLRTLWVDRGSPLEEMRARGEFIPLEEDEIVFEIRSMLKGLRGASGRLVSDHDRNLLGDLEGHLTEDADELEAMCSRFLDLTSKMRDAFVVARRSGYFRSIDVFLADDEAKKAFVPMAQELREAGDGSLSKGIAIRMSRRSI
jgi:biotin synthase-like enzyme